MSSLTLYLIIPDNMCYVNWRKVLSLSYLRMYSQRAMMFLFSVYSWGKSIVEEQ